MGPKKLSETRLKPDSNVGSGGVRRFVLPGGKTRITRITTFCPDIIGPGPTHVYLIEDEALILVDTGIPTHLAQAFFYGWRNQPMPPEIGALTADHSEKELLEGLELAGYSAGDIDLIVISHGHLDHFLMADAVLSRGNAKVSAHVLDTPGICNPWGLIHHWLSRQHQIAGTGMPEAVEAKKRFGKTSGGGSAYASLRFSFEVDSPIFRDGPLDLGGHTLQRVQARHLPGHSPGSVGLLVGEEGESRALICGDVLLHPITPHPDDLLVYLQTLNRLKEFDDVDLVLPAHGKAIHNLGSRVQFLQRHHEKRLRLTYEACAEPKCVWDIASMPKYFDSYVDPVKFNFLAGTEALVHMELLAMADGLNRFHIREGVHYFQNSGEPFEEVYSRINQLTEDNNVKTLMRY